MKCLSQPDEVNSPIKGEGVVGGSAVCCIVLLWSAVFSVQCLSVSQRGRRVEPGQQKAHYWGYSDKAGVDLLGITLMDQAGFRPLFSHTYMASQVPSFSPKFLQGFPDNSGLSWGEEGLRQELQCPTQPMGKWVG